jgi:hypothetical protein
VERIEVSTSTGAAVNAPEVRRQDAAKPRARAMSSEEILNHGAPSSEAPEVEAPRRALTMEELLDA